jgi:tRNA-specific 2-thiouridylase
MLRRARSLECDYLATGHYARIEEDKKAGRFLLKKALDQSKDQSYVLYNLTQQQLSSVLFPMGEMTKSQARELASKSGLINAKKPDSQDICFVPNGDYSAFVEKFSEKKIVKGNFIDANGVILGTHQGISNYTIGQRKGLGIALGKPVYVTEINTADNTVTIEDEEKLFNKELLAYDVNFISIEKLTEPLRVMAKTRYRQPEQPCVITQNPDGTVRVVFDSSQRAITPGQAVVFYDGDTVVGGGTIMKQKG